METSMASQADTLAASQFLPGPTVQPAAPALVWPPIVLLVFFWTTYSVWRWTELGLSLGFMGFLMLVGIEGLATLLFAVWWLVASRVSWPERFLVIGVGITGGIGAVLLGHKMLGPFLVLPGLPIVLTTWTLGLVVVRKWPVRRRGLFLASTVCLSWGAFLLLRAEGMEGDGQLTLGWRWTHT